MKMLQARVGGKCEKFSTNVNFHSVPSYFVCPATFYSIVCLFVFVRSMGQPIGNDVVNGIII